MSSEEGVDNLFVKKLAERLLKRDYQLGSRVLNPSNPQDIVYAEDISEAYSPVISFLTGSEWEGLAKIVNSWNEDRLNEDEGFQEYMTQESLFEELIGKCQMVPSYVQVRSKLGGQVAEKFLEGTEAIESDVTLYAKLDEDRTKRYSKAEMQDIVCLVEILARGDKEAIIADYAAYKRIKRKENHEKRERVKENNTEIIKRVKELNIWFPYSSDNDQWKADPRTAARAEAFLQLVEDCKEKMKRQHCLLQYISKRRVTNKTVEDLDRNITVMKLYVE